MINVGISTGITAQVDFSLLEQAALETIQQARKEPDRAHSEAFILITGDEQLHELNKKYLEIDAPTDVLAFPADTIDPETNTNYLGDILISYPRAQAQAAEGGHAVEEELRLLVVHGMLHLLGYDHSEPDEKAKMWAVQSHILSALGCPLSPP
jgi:probable rRNA maturation factor